MIRTLLIIAGASSVLALATLGGAAAIGGRDLARHGWAWTFQDDGGDSIRFERENGAPVSPRVTRTLAWTGGDSLILDLPYDVTYVQGAEAGVVVTGPKDLADGVSLVGSRLTMTGVDGRRERVVFGWDENGPTGVADSERLSIVVTAPAVTKFEVRGSADLDIRAYDQPTLALDVSGSGNVEASGLARAVTVDVTGSGDADLSNIGTVSARVDISGSGDAAVAPTTQADVEITGSGDVTLTTQPEKVTSSITGSGDLIRD